MRSPVMLNHRYIIAAVLALCCALPVTAQTLLQMYPIADSVTRITAREESLVVLCKKKLMERYITFVGIKGEKEALLVAVTLQPIENVKKEISLTARFKGTTPVIGKVETWGYIYDRNQDGKIDYLTLQGGAAPVWTDDMPKDYPDRNIGLNTGQMELLIAHSTLVFNHWADDNFDGKLDGAVHIDMFPQRDWVKRRLVLQSSTFDGNFDQISSFRKLPGDIADSVVAYDDGVPYFPIGEESPRMFGKKMFGETDNILALLNKAAAECKIEKKLRGVPKKEDE